MHGTPLATGTAGGVLWRAGVMALLCAALSLVCLALAGCATSREEKEKEAAREQAEKQGNVAQIPIVLPQDVPKLGKPLEISEFRNSQVRWIIGEAGGVQPNMAKRLRAATFHYRSESQWRKILPLLRDEDKCVAAHVVLTLATASPLRSSAADWNGLRVGPDQYKKGKPVNLEPEERMALYKRWRNFLDGLEIARLREGVVSPLNVEPTTPASPASRGGAAPKLDLGPPGAPKL
ncbi:hypothetical protein DB346_15925 [Verrucomicrobia bacterium LW23]|nr:hypothetical protein DB346_15925 [Verrucomicrobia bacterium LW23]